MLKPEHFIPQALDEAVPAVLSTQMAQRAVGKPKYQVIYSTDGTFSTAITSSGALSIAVGVFDSLDVAKNQAKIWASIQNSRNDQPRRYYAVVILTPFIVSDIIT